MLQETKVWTHLIWSCDDIVRSPLLLLETKRKLRSVLQWFSSSLQCSASNGFNFLVQQRVQNIRILIDTALKVAQRELLKKTKAVLVTIELHRFSVWSKIITTYSFLCPRTGTSHTSHGQWSLTVDPFTVKRIWTSAGKAMLIMEDCLF